jgi:hypothetical protein
MAHDKIKAMRERLMPPLTPDNLKLLQSGRLPTQSKAIIKQPRRHEEEDLHTAICNYIRLQYPDALFNTDLSGVKLPIHTARKVAQLRSSRAYPDIVIYETNGTFNALFLEVKKETPFKLNGELKSSEHLQEQAIMINKLNNRGYYACFVWTFDMAKNVIDKYFNT